MTVVQPSPEEQAMYAEVTSALQAIAARHPTITALRVVALLGHACGVAIAMSAFLNERDLARQTAIDNLDFAVARIDRARGGLPPNHPQTGRPA